MLAVRRRCTCRAMLEALIDLLYDTACFVLGWTLLRGVSLGYYPRCSFADGVRSNSTDAGIARVVGFVAFIAFGVGVGIWLHSS